MSNSTVHGFKKRSLLVSGALVAGLIVFLAWVALYLVNIGLLKDSIRGLVAARISGDAYIPVSDRHAIVEFENTFESPPIVMVTSTTLPQFEYAVTDITETSFKIELGSRATIGHAFDWYASWSPRLHREFVNELAGMPETMSFSWANEIQTARYTGYQSRRPTEFHVVGMSAADISDADDQMPFLDAILDAARENYNKTFFCSFLDKLRYKLRQRGLRCDLNETNQEYWQTIDTSNWRIEDTANGIRVFEESSSHSTLDDRQFATLLSSVKKADISVHNNQMLDFVDSLDPDVSFKLLHFDTHSDFYIYSEPRLVRSPEMIGDFVNTLLADGRLEEVYWVLPDWSATSGFRPLYWEAELVRFEDIYEFDPYLEGPTTLEVYVHQESGAVFFYGPPEHLPIDELRTVKIHKVLVDDLPQFDSDDRIMLEFDADFFSNSGYDTFLAPSFNPSVEALQTRLDQVVRTLLEKNVRPEFAFLCLSPGYVTIEDQAAIFRAFGDAMRANQLQDELLGYRHNTDAGIDPNAQNVGRHDILGRLLFDASMRDSERWPGDQLIHVNREDAEYRSLIEQIRQDLSLNKFESESVAYELDRFDGQLDGVIDLLDVEYYAAKEDLQQVLPNAN